MRSLISIAFMTLGLVSIEARIYCKEGYRWCAAQDGLKGTFQYCQDGVVNTGACFGEGLCFKEGDDINCVMVSNSTSPAMDKRFATLTTNDIYGTLQTLGKATKNGSPSDMSTVIQAGINGMRRGPGQVGEFFRVFNDLLTQNRGTVVNQMKKAIPDIAAIGGSSATLINVIKTFAGNEQQMAQLMASAFQEMNTDSNAQTRVRDLIVAVTSAARSSGCSNCGTIGTASGIASAIDKFETVLRNKYLCDDGTTGFPQFPGSSLGAVLESALNSNSNDMLKFIAAAVANANENISDFQKGMVIVLQLAQSSQNTIGVLVADTMLAIQGNPTQLINLLTRITIVFDTYDCIIKALFEAYMKASGFVTYCIGGVLFKVILMCFMIMTIIWVPLCCCC
ncbi:hypothetical protein AX774_g3898 [Zancudomyces culisetae]|uniref:Uncharacterized protein n=1 Tax=Zancudomyces culisetae TaxID=1213189 RepID=A0A1R1PNS5_ZANCU|nr:hypothetical protein AX774_g3898 [Zancudomyces culisetae]|eukprot:OMH82619.1 hypothetical protein AX774_g3898 [Zancudomyces culisetae]